MAIVFDASDQSIAVSGKWAGGAGRSRKQVETKAHVRERVVCELARGGDGPRGALLQREAAVSFNEVQVIALRQMRRSLLERRASRRGRGRSVRRGTSARAAAERSRSCWSRRGSQRGEERTRRAAQRRRASGERATL